MTRNVLDLMACVTPTLVSLATMLSHSNACLQEEFWGNGTSMALRGPEMDGVTV